MQLVTVWRLYTLTKLLKLFSRVKHKQIKSAFFALFILLGTSSYALSHLKNDFRDTNNSYNFGIYIDAVSDHLPFDLFDNKWSSLPSTAKDNNAFYSIVDETHLELGDFNIGFFKQKIGEIYVNDGLVQTWYNSANDFSFLLSTSTINQNLGTTPIVGRGNAADIYGFYFQKIIALSSKHYFSAKLKVNVANNLHNIKINGQTSSEKFLGSIDYYYSDKNIIMNGIKKSKNTYGIGYGLDLEYIYDNDSIYLYLGVFNIESYIYWNNVTFMHYDFDSQTIYKGNDGYNHYKPFGVGYYKYNVDFKQKLPTYYKTALNYKLEDNLALGYNLSVYDELIYNEFYTNFKLDDVMYKIGYKFESELESKDVILGIYCKNFIVESSTHLSRSSSLFLLNLKVSF